MIDRDSVEKRLEAARNELSALCQGKRWLMTIPADRNNDSDLIIAAALRDIPALLDALETAQINADHAVSAWEQAQEDIKKLRDKR